MMFNVKTLSSSFPASISLSLQVLNSPKSIIVKSPPQFGLTCLAHHLVLNSWNQNNIWIYLDASKIKKNALDKAVLEELRSTFQTDNKDNIKCIILDSWKNTMHGGMKILKGLSNLFKETPIIVMQTIDANDFLQEPESENIDREFEVMHLLALPKTEIRKMVSSYNKEIYIDEEDKVVNKFNHAMAPSLSSNASIILHNSALSVPPQQASLNLCNATNICCNSVIFCSTSVILSSVISLASAQI